MTEDVLEPFAVPEYFFDRFTNFEIKNGLVSCVAVREQDGQAIAVFRLVTTLCGMAASVAAREKVLQEAAAITENVVKLVAG